MDDLTETPPPPSAAVAAVFETWESDDRARALTLRRRIYELASATDGVGPLTETLKWGQPAYLTDKTGAGTTLRIGSAKGGGVGLYVQCTSRVVETVRMIHDRDVSWDGTRGLILRPDAPLPEAAVDAMIHAALTYRL